MRLSVFLYIYAIHETINLLDHKMSERNGTPISVKQKLRRSPTILKSQNIFAQKKDGFYTVL